MDQWFFQNKILFVKIRFYYTGWFLVLKFYGLSLHLKFIFYRILIIAMKAAFLYFFTCLFLGNAVFSQTTDSALVSQKLENYIRLQYDNDFFSATDRYYTQGIQLAVIHPVIRFSPFSYALIRLNKNALNYYGLQFEQDCFTPRSIRYDTLNYTERPYAAVFFVSHALSSLNPEKKMALKTQLDLGVIGPCARCEDEQKAIHRALVNIQPLGWEYQLKTNYIINYRAAFEKGIFNKTNREVIVNAAARLGTLYTDASVGITGRMGFFSPYFSNLGMDKHHTYRKSNFQFYGILKGNARLVGYNATLQGGVFGNDDIYTVADNKIDRVVVDALAGFVLTYKRISLEYSKLYISREFSGGLDHGWGKCVIMYCF
jgi:lipid A 3-O-deacylase